MNVRSCWDSLVGMRYISRPEFVRSTVLGSSRLVLALTFWLNLWVAIKFVMFTNSVGSLPLRVGLLLRERLTID